MYNAQEFSQSLACLLTPHDIVIAILVETQLTNTMLSPALQNELSLYLIDMIERDEERVYQFISEHSYAKICSFYSLKSFCQQLMNDFESHDKQILVKVICETVCDRFAPIDWIGDR